ncbi:hypothetical protein CAY60_010215 [Shouchella clausii]|uniref:Transmembrane protein n=2 Tax=Shouchella clausii TaxID=79880 RepID=Q5WEQ3_SHOC1|nr:MULTISPECIES: hypothetical protein [Shouchella]MCM3313352.1 hypothetical protein [Psychrobacillus sp. MER TA 17]MCM3380405.1 hypothetical protein [Shouchella rhizosphaerae]MCZ1180739.1 hypothetical protein [Shouchella clausii]MDO7281999.1 hypothetical protein [Shouchella clausii]MDO7302094.1 hypothetical protein [Shouchella clausii]
MAKRFRGFPPPHPPHCPPKKGWGFKNILLQVLPPIIVFQLLRTLFFPTTFDLIVLTVIIVLFFCLFLRIF